MRISDWSSDVCSSDLARRGREIMVADRLADRHPIGVARSLGEGAVDIGPGGRLRRGVPRQLPGIVRRSVAELAGRIAVIIILGRARVLALVADRHADVRSAEHTSELQALMRISY